ncbi:MAG: hypothetical protein ACM3QX_16860 [Syntrophomonadaceae bacterium]
MKRSFAILAGLIFYQNLVFCQLNSRLDLEAGYFNIQNPVLSSEENLLMRADGELSYDYSGDYSSFNTLARIIPEWSGIETGMRSLKMGAKAGYSMQTEASSYGITASAKRNLYKSYQPAICHDVLSLQGDYTYNLSSESILHLSPGYYRQTINYESKQTTENFMLNLAAEKSIYPGVTGEGGIYSELFSIREKSGSWPLQKEKFVPGWKIGPEVNITFSGEVIAALQYRFLLVNSKSTEFPSNEQMVRFMAGVMPEENVSIMLLADYYWHKIKVIKGTSNDEVSILNYSSLNYENRVLLKIGYDVTEALEVYFRTGYSRENLLNDTFSEKSWSLMFGLSFTK